MPNVEENRATWNAGESWSRQGDEWSDSWGGTELMWLGTVLPRIHRFVPTGSLLELAPGFGRWTQYLKDLCDELVVVDLAERCIEACRERFASERHIAYHVNDGRSLEMVPDDSVDFVFSFDSLVHAEGDVLDAYLEQLATKLRPDGVGFVHHSNMAAFRGRAALARRVPPRLRAPLTARGVLVNSYAWRAESVSAESVAAQCERVGLVAISQEKINWEYGRQTIDALTTFTRRGSRWDRPPVVTENPRFMDEARRMADLSRLYGLARFGADGRA